MKLLLKPFQFAIIFCVLIYIWQVFSTLNKYQRFEKIINEDAAGYYLILPTLLIYNDPEFAFIDSSIRKQEKFNNYFPPVVNQLENKKKVCKYYSGVALLQLPFFIVGNTILQQFKSYNGFELPYHLIILLSVVFYVSWSIILLFKCFKLLNIPWYWSMAMVTVVIFGTNLQLYTTYDLAYSHSYSFFCFIALIYCTIKYKLNPNLKSILLIGLLMGLIITIRPANFLITLVPLFIIPFSIIKTHLKGHILPLLASLCFAPIIQMLVWHWQTGDWIVYPYTTEKLDIFNPQFAELLWSYNCGWITYTPIMPIILIISCLALLLNKKFKILLGTVIIIFPSIYIIASWYYIHYGCTLGCRPITEFYGPIIVLFAYAIKSILNHKWFYSFCIALAISSIIYNQILHYQFSNFILNSCEMNKEKFELIFLKTHPYYAYSTYDFWNFDSKKDSLIYEVPLNKKLIKINNTKEFDTTSTTLNYTNNNNQILLTIEFDAVMKNKVNESVISILLKDEEKYIDLHHLLLKRILKQDNQIKSLKYEIPISKSFNSLNISLMLKSLSRDSETKIWLKTIKLNQLKTTLP